VAEALSPTELFWVEGMANDRTDPVTVWRASRAGGTPTMMASFPYVTSLDSVPFSDIALSDDALILGGTWRAPVALPLQGGPMRALDATELPALFGWYAGTSGAGVFWSEPRPGRDRDDS